MARDITVAELVELLSDYDADMPVRFAHQPSYPFQLHIQHQLAVRTDDKGTKSVYLLDGDQVYDAPYAPGQIFEALTDDEVEGDDDEEEGCSAVLPDGDSCDVLRFAHDSADHAFVSGAQS